MFVCVHIKCLRCGSLRHPAGRPEAVVQQLGSCEMPIAAVPSWRLIEKDEVIYIYIIICFKLLALLFSSSKRFSEM